MAQEGNRAPNAERPTVEGSPVITLFGKRMSMNSEAEAPGGRASRDASPGYDSSGERRVFWLITILFLCVLGAVAAGVYFLAVRGGGRAAGKQAAPPAGASSTGTTAQPVPPPAAGKEPVAPAAAQAPPPPAPAPAPQPASPAPAAVQPAAGKQAQGVAGRAAPPLPVTETKRAKAEPQDPPRLRKKQAASQQPPAKARAGADKLPSAQKEYLQKLREQREQYERDKARGKYQEFPK